MSPLDELRIAAEHLPVAIWMGRVPSGEVVYINDEFRKVLGLDEPPDALRGGFVEPYGVHKPDGTPYPEAEMPYERCLAARATVVVDDLVIHRRDGRKVNLRVFAKPIFDESGTLVYVLEAFTDITREVEAEKARAEGERRLARSQRLESIGQLVAGIAHDFNNLLTVTKLVVSRLRAQEDDAAKLEALADVDAVTESAIALIRNLLGFAGRANQVLARVDLGAIVKAVVELAQRTFDRRIAVRAEIRSERAAILADRSQLEQVLMNLLLNARDAIELSGEVVVRVEARALAANEVGASAAGEYVVLEVADTGSGIDPSIRDRVFEPYFTTKTMGPVKGTGLGLSTVHGIVRAHSAFIEIDDNAPRGTTMRIAFPRAAGSETSAAVERAPSPAAPVREGDTLVLLVDDERLVREASKSSLEALGYRVVEAENGTQALELFARHEKELAVVVLDLVMPGVPTPDVLKHIRAAQPDLPIVLATGSVIDDVVRESVGDRVSGWLTKPFGEAELVRAFRQLGL